MDAKTCSNYYTNKFIRFGKNQFVFVPFISFLFYVILMNEVKEIMQIEVFTISRDLTWMGIPGIDGKPFDPIVLSKEATMYIKQVYKVTSFISIMAFVNNIYERFLKRMFARELHTRWYDVKHVEYPYDKDKMELIIGEVHRETDLELSSKPEYLKIEEEGLFQNIFITGTIGTGKTIAAMTQILLQCIYKFYDNPKKKFAMLCLDVKGNFYKFVYAFAREVGRWNDVITIEVDGDYYYNPLHKPNLTEVELAGRCRYILELFTGKTSDAYWLGKAEDFMVELFKLIRLYNDGYINFEETHKCGLDWEYRKKKIGEVQKMYDENKLEEDDEYNFKALLNYFTFEYNIQDDKIKGFITSSLTTMTQPFISTKPMARTFSPNKEDINFLGFEETIREGKIVVFKINANKEPKVAKLIAAYLKLDYQSEIMITLEKGKNSIEAQRVKITLCDEYQEYCTRNDGKFLSQSREPKSITVCATQSYSSVKQALGNDDTQTNMLLQSFVNKIWFRSDDIDYTIPRIIKQVGKVLKKKISTSVTENAQKSRTNFSIGKVLGSGKNLSSGMSVSEQKEDKFDEVFIGQKLSMGKAIAYISDGEKIKEPTVVHCTRMHKEGRIIYDEDKKVIRFISDNAEVFKNIGEIDIDELEAGLSVKREIIETEDPEKFMKQESERLKKVAGGEGLVFHAPSLDKKEPEEKKTPREDEIVFDKTLGEYRQATPDEAFEKRKKFLAEVKKAEEQQSEKIPEEIYEEMPEEMYEEIPEEMYQEIYEKAETEEALPAFEAQLTFRFNSKEEHDQESADQEIETENEPEEVEEQEEENTGESESGSDVFEKYTF